MKEKKWYKNIFSALLFGLFVLIVGFILFWWFGNKERETYYQTMIDNLSDEKMEVFPKKLRFKGFPFLYQSENVDFIVKNTHFYSMHDPILLSAKQCHIINQALIPDAWNLKCLTLRAGIPFKDPLLNQFQINNPEFMINYSLKNDLTHKNRIDFTANQIMMTITPDLPILMKEKKSSLLETIPFNFFMKKAWLSIGNERQNSIIKGSFHQLKWGNCLESKEDQFRFLCFDSSKIGQEAEGEIHKVKFNILVYETDNFFNGEIKFDHQIIKNLVDQIQKWKEQIGKLEIQNITIFFNETAFLSFEGNIDNHALDFVIQLNGEKAVFKDFLDNLVPRTNLYISDFLYESFYKLSKEEGQNRVLNIRIDEQMISIGEIQFPTQFLNMLTKKEDE